VTGTSSPFTHRLVLLDDHEAFWLDAIRVACNGRVPAPTLARAQAIRCLFKGAERHHARQDSAEGQP